MATKNHTIQVDANAPATAGRLKTLLEYKELLLSLATRDYRVRFVQTRLGYVWAIVQPLVLMLILTFVFGKMLNVDTGGIVYPIFALSGQVLWSYFSFSAVQGGQSLVQSQHMIRKIWFPRVVLPLSKAAVGFMDLAIGLVVLGVAMAFFKALPSANILTLPLAIIFTWIAGTGVSLWTSALSIRYRDIQHALPYFIQFLFFLTPVAYPAGVLSKSLPESISWAAYLNPMSGIIDLARFGLFDANIEWNSVLLSAGVAIVLLITGWHYFHKVERNMADTL
ncbi:MAG: ABC transporter permease [Flavobacteriia bacterium]|nr:ABC transporter permease [Flavobacteriia bacterium]